MKLRFVFIIILILFVVSTCSPKQQTVERYMEEGMEIIVNHLEPYKIEGEPTTIRLEELFIIDSERDELVDAGLTTINNFDVDSENNLYILSSRTEKDLFP